MERTTATTQRHMDIRHRVLKLFIKDKLLQVMADREGYQIEVDRWWREKQDFDQLEAARTAMLASTVDAAAHKKQVGSAHVDQPLSACLVLSISRLGFSSCLL